MRKPSLFGIATVLVLAAMLVFVVSLAADIDLNFATAAGVLAPLGLG